MEIEPLENGNIDPAKLKLDPEARETSGRRAHPKDAQIIKCACGCGTDIFDRNRNGSIRYVVGHIWRGKKRIGENRNQHGEKNNNWRGGRIIAAEGYIKIRVEGHPRAHGRGQYVREHILAAEKKLGRELTSPEVCHHLNHNKTDNRPENIVVLTNGEHSSLHRKEEIAQGKHLFGGHD